MELTKILEEIMDWRQRTRNVWSQPEPLSMAMMELAYWNSHLAEQVSAAHQIVSDKQITAYLKHRKTETQGDAEMNAKKDALEHRKDYEHIKAVNKSTSEFLSTLQSRLRVLTEQARANI